MRIALGLSLFAAVAVSACAPTMGQSRYQMELDRLDQSCQARGGILSPTGRIDTGRPQLEYTCRITGQPSDRLQPRP